MLINFMRAQYLSRTNPDVPDPRDQKPRQNEVEAFYNSLGGKIHLSFFIKDLQVRTKSRSYPIRFSQEPAGKTLEALFQAQAGRKIGLVTDSHLAKHYRADIRKAFQKHGIKAHLFVIPAGEKSKNRRVKEQIEDYFLANRFDRKSLFVALGGGVVGDLVGYTASTFFRGIDFIQIPTSLLAMVDSSVGGKTGVDTPHGKNLIGSFHQPAEVRVNLDFLKTLPEKNFLEGLGEVLKAGFIRDKSLVNVLVRNRDAVLKRETKTLSRVIHASLVVKRDVVGKDEKETGGLRKILNYGHTIGHAVELLARFRVAHGFCVAIGMSAEARLAVKLGILKDSARLEMDELIASYGLPLSIPKNLNPNALVEAMLLDKKSTDGKIQFSLCSEIGRMEVAGGTYAVAAPKKLILEVLREARA